ncbi:MAG: protein-disulfide reductase DsbD domain-containing protein [Alphaproteobacteria bacterium]
MKRILALLALLPTLAQADEIYGNVEFLNGWRLSDGSYQTAIDFDLLEGWKTYWRVPGPGGIPPAFDWSASTNIANIEITWPTPKVSQTYGLTSIGYSHPVTLPVRITPIEASKAVIVDLKLEFGVCSDICVPADARFNVTLGNLPDAGVSAIKSALRDTTQTARQGGIRSATCALTLNGSGFDIEANLKFANAPNGPRTTVIEYANPDIWIDIAQTSITGRNLTANATMEFYGSGMLTIDRSAIRITVLEGNRPVEVIGCPAT